MQKFLLTLLLLLGGIFKIAAYDFVVDGVYYDIVSFTDRTCEVTRAPVSTGYVGNVVVPDNVVYNSTTVKVIGIENSAFQGNEGLTGISLGNNLRDIGSNAFKGCTSLRSVAIPSGVKRIYSSAFRNCTGLVELTIGGGVEEIDDFCFSQCTQIKKITFENGTKSLKVGWCVDRLNTKKIGQFSASALEELYLGRNLIYPDDDLHGNSPFNDLRTLKKVTLGGGATVIGPNLFSSCTGLESFSTTVVITEIGNSAFYRDYSLTSLDFGSAVRTIGDCAFYGCSSLESVGCGSNVETIGEFAFFRTAIRSFELSSNLVSMGTKAFSECPVLQEINIPSGTVGDQAFLSCASLAKVTLGPGVGLVYVYAFSKCAALEDVIINSNALSMKNYVFSDSENILNVYCSSPTPPALAYPSVFSNRTYMNATLHIPATSAAAYSAARGWQNFWNVRTDYAGIGNVECNTAEHLVRIVDGAIHTDPEATACHISGRTVDIGSALNPGVYIVTFRDGFTVKVMVP